jgi:hypothetical protein
MGPRPCKQAALWVHARLDDGVACGSPRAQRWATITFMPANDSAADPRHALPARAYELQRAAAALRNHSSSAQAVPTLPATLAQVRETLDLLVISIQRMAHGVVDWPGEDGQGADEDAAPPEARALRWHLGATAEALRDSREACSASEEWSRRLLAEPFDADEETVSPTALEGLAGTVRFPPATWTWDVERRWRG